MTSSLFPRGLVAAASVDASTVLVISAVILAFLAAVATGTRAYRTPYAPATNRSSSRPVTGTAKPDFSDLAPPEPRLMLRLEKALLFGLAGYLFFDRGFAWFHIPGTPLFIGELIIAFGLVAVLASRPRLGPILRASGSFKALTAYMSWGAFLLLGAISTYTFDAIRDAALWYYGIVAVFVITLVVSRPARVNSWLRLFGKTLPFALIWFPVAVILDSALSSKFPLVPDSAIPIVSHSTGNLTVMAAVAIGFIWLVDQDRELFSQRQRVLLTSFGTLVILFGAMRNRGGFVAAAVGLGIAFLFLRRKRTEMSMIMVGAVVLLLIVGLLGNVRIALFEGREVSVDQLLNNLTSVIDPDAGGFRQRTTTEWRLEIWTQVFHDVSTEFPLTGFGPGPDLGERYNITTDPTTPLRNPHNSHVGVLARSGFVGAILWFMIWWVWIVELLLTRRRLMARGRYREAGIGVWLLVSIPTILVNAIFDPTLEGPQVAWWLWAFLGFGISYTTLERTGRLPQLSLREPPKPGTSLPELPAPTGATS
ncbi:MAG: O-antigen ligase family protein [Actinomycetota bacterium]|nr:O-antigen ligase family protein [Actinomycetota bacterium]